MYFNEDLINLTLVIHEYSTRNVPPVKRGGPKKIFFFFKFTFNKISYLSCTHCVVHYTLLYIFGGACRNALIVQLSCTIGQKYRFTERETDNSVHVFFHKIYVQIVPCERRTEYIFSLDCTRGGLTPSKSNKRISINLGLKIRSKRESTYCI